jgi:hypothetical protein
MKIYMPEKWDLFKCHILIDLLKLYFVPRNSIPSMHVYRATIQDCRKTYFKIPERIPDF